MLPGEERHMKYHRAPLFSPEHEEPVENGRSYVRVTTKADERHEQAHSLNTSAYLPLPSFEMIEGEQYR